MKELNICQIVYLFALNKVFLYANSFFNLSQIDNLMIVCRLRQDIRKCADFCKAKITTQNQFGSNLYPARE